MKKAILIGLSLFFCDFAGNTQVISGFKGKRTIVGVGTSISPIINDGKVHYGYGLDIERVKQNYVSLNYSFKYFNSEMKVRSLRNSSSYYNEDLGLDEYYEPAGSFRLKRQEHKVTYKFYSKRKGSLAPLGAYWNMGLSFDINNINAEKFVMDRTAGTMYSGDKELTYFDVVPHISRGYKFVVGENLFLDLEFMFRFSYVEYLPLEEDEFYGFNSMEHAVKGDVKYTNLINSLFMVNFGLKYAL